ncbi:hypothetical protein [Stieleria varia]|uniref:hypothetical protein n=1 Tax=Stieleria varia TaxID=2528005 RepID=UPI0011B56656|nr:hypothetical protein [Stieleria varia]
MNPAKTRDQMGFDDRQSVKREIAEVGIHRRRRTIVVASIGATVTSETYGTTRGGSDDESIVPKLARRASRIN